MTPERWQQIEQLYHKALKLDSGQRAAFLQEACARDKALRVEVESLLGCEEDAKSFIEAPALEMAANVMAEDRTQSMVGRQLSSYKILSLLGVGGMGEVYRARDTKLRREVALKVLPEAFADDPERVARFRREARMVAALNHPNIAGIYGLEESDGVSYLVLELVPGQTLAERLAARRLSVEEALRICGQVAEALEAAHEKGIIHRDLKPANIKVTPEGKVKVLDFGLAKAFADEGAVDLSSASTQSAGATVEGQILGTPSYMSPEQVRGREADPRTDIWALGCLLYELLTGRPAFRGETASDTLAKVLEREPDWEALPESTPLEIRRLLRRCLQKEANLRLRAIGDVLIEIREALQGFMDGPRRTRRATLVLVLVLGGLGAAVLAAALWYSISKLGRETDKPRETLAHAAFTQLTNQLGEESFPSLSPDGRLVVYASRTAGNWDIYLLRIGGQNPINLTKGSPADDTQAVFSPDGDFIAFRSERDRGGIFVMGATGESVRRLTDFGYNPAWSPDGSQIVFAAQGFDIPSSRGLLSQLWTVTVATGSIRQLTMVRDAVQPSWSPHGGRIAFWGSTVSGQRDIWTIPSSGVEVIPVTNDSALDWNPVWSPDGKFLYFCSDRGGSMNLWRVPIEERSGRVLREPEPVTTGGGGAASRQNLSISRDGRRLVFVERIGKSNLQKVAFDPNRETVVGQPIWITQGSRQANTPDPSPDGEWVAFSSMGAPQEDLFLIRRDGTGERQITNDPSRDRFSRWSPDGKRIAFYSNRLSGRFQIWAINPDGSGLQRLGETDQPLIIPSWSPDNLRVAYYTAGQFENFISELNKPWKDHSERLPDFSEADVFGVNSWSPDGRRLAGHVLSKKSSTNNPNGTAMYSLESKRFEKLTDFGWAPVWLSDSRRLLFPYQDKICLVDSRSKKVHEIFSTGSYTIFPYSLSVSRDNRWLYFALEMNEADIWLMTLQ
jgi:eukaryotic-like serine/threonine-protein kinase